MGRQSKQLAEVRERAARLVFDADRSARVAMGGHRGDCGEAGLHGCNGLERAFFGQPPPAKQQRAHTPYLRATVLKAAQCARLVDQALLLLDRVMSPPAWLRRRRPE